MGDGVVVLAAVWSGPSLAALKRVSTFMCEHESLAPFPLYVADLDSPPSKLQAFVDGVNARGRCIWLSGDECVYVSDKLLGDDWEVDVLAGCQAVTDGNRT